jgi:hypothetical protein
VGRGRVGLTVADGAATLVLDAAGDGATIVLSGVGITLGIIELESEQLIVESVRTMSASRIFILTSMNRPWVILWTQREATNPKSVRRTTRNYITTL